MIEIILLFLGVYGIAAAPGLHTVNHDCLGNEAEMILPGLPGSDNLNEKALPASKLYARENTILPGSQNLAERSQIPQELPGTKNIAEKRIPDFVLRRLYHPLTFSEED